MAMNRVAGRKAIGRDSVTYSEVRPLSSPQMLEEFARFMVFKCRRRS